MCILFFPITHPEKYFVKFVHILASLFNHGNKLWFYMQELTPGNLKKDFPITYTLTGKITEKNGKLQIHLMQDTPIIFNVQILNCMSGFCLLFVIPFSVSLLIMIF